MNILFRTEICSDGYELAERRSTQGDRPELFLIPKSERRRVVSPLDKAGLYRNYAVDLSPEAILDLARQFGPLERLQPTAPVKGSGLSVNGEPLGIWQNLDVQRPTLPALRDAVLVFDMLKAGQKTELADLIKWTRSGICLRKDLGKNRRGTPHFREYRIARSPSTIEESDVLKAGRWFVVQQINKWMTGSVSPRLFIHDQTDEARIFLEPQSLLGGLFLQFADAIERGELSAQCVICGTWFNRLRKDQLYCSPACKAKSYRQSRKEARQP